MKKTLIFILSLVLAIGLMIPAVSAGAVPPYTITVGAADSTGPPGAPLVALINWSGTSPPQSGETDTVFPITANGGTVTLTAPLSTSNGTLQFFVFRQWYISTPSTPPASPTPQPLDQRTITFTVDSNKIAIARYQQIVSLKPINPTQPDVNPVGIEHTVWVNIGIPVAGVKVMFRIDGANSASSGFAITDATGQATFTYTGDNDGQDNIWAYLDSNGNGYYDDGEPRSPNTTIKSWVENFFTGGGNIKDGKKVIWTFAGTAGVLPEGGVVGNFEIVNHTTKVSYHLDQFAMLSFYGDETGSPPASHNTARFRASGTGSDGSTVNLVVIIEDADEPGKGKDKIAVVEMVSTPPPPAPPVTEPWIGQIFFTPTPPPPPPTLVTISGGNFQVHNVQ